MFTDFLVGENGNLFTPRAKGKRIIYKCPKPSSFFVFAAFLNINLFVPSAQPTFTMNNNLVAAQRRGIF